MGIKRRGRPAGTIAKTRWGVRDRAALARWVRRAVGCLFGGSVRKAAAQGGVTLSVLQGYRDGTKGEMSEGVRRSQFFRLGETYGEPMVSPEGVLVWGLWGPGAPLEPVTGPTTGLRLADLLARPSTPSRVRRRKASRLVNLLTNAIQRLAQSAHAVDHQRARERIRHALRGDAVAKITPAMAALWPQREEGRGFDFAGPFVWSEGDEWFISHTLPPP